MGVEDATPSQERERKRKEKKTGAQTPATETLPKREKSKKSKPSQGDYPGTVLGESEGLKSHLGEVKRQGKKLEDAVNPGDEELGKDHKKSKKRERELEGVQGGVSEDFGDGEKKGKKRKKDKGQGKDEDDVQEPKKKRKNKTGFPDPNEDASLSNQARKALAYAFAQFHRPSSWKFNKARQNWLVRNYWANEMIPETYLSLLTSYLANVQGGVRENLIKQCRAALAPPDTNTVASGPANSSSEVPVSDKQQTIPTGENAIKQKRGRVLLEALVSSGEI